MLAQFFQHRAHIHASGHVLGDFGVVQRLCGGEQKRLGDADRFLARFGGLVDHIVHLALLSRVAFRRREQSRNIWHFNILTQTIHQTSESGRVARSGRAQPDRRERLVLTQFDLPLAHQFQRRGE